MKIDPHFKKSLKILLNFKPWKLSLLFALTFFHGIFSGFSIVMLIPLLQILTGGSQGQKNQVVQIFSEIANTIGLKLNLGTILITYVILLTSMALLQLFKSLLDARFQHTFIYQIRQRLFYKIIMADWKLLNNRSKTSHLQVFTTEVPNLADYFFFLLRVFTGLIMAASYVTWAIIVSAEFTLFIIILGLALFFLLRKFLFRSFSLGDGYVNSYNQLLKYMDDFWLTVKMAKVHSSENFYYSKFKSVSSSLLDLEYQMQKNQSFPIFIYRITGIFVLVLAIYIGYHFDLIPLTSFFILIILFSRIYPQFTRINTDISLLISKFASVKMVMQVEEDFPDRKSYPQKKLIPLPLKNEIRIESLNFSYPGKKKLFKNFSTRISAYTMTGILGQSGKGKTTLIDLIAGLQLPLKGKILIDDQILANENLPRWRNGIGYLPQDSFFIDGSIRENLLWDSNTSITDEEIRKILDQVNGLYLINRYKNGLDEEIVNYQFHFSGGERQRLAMARVLLRKPEILLLDEATSSLDEENEKQIMNLLAELKNKITIIFITHRHSVLPWFDKAIWLDS